MVKATCFYKTICCIFLFTFMGLSVLADGGQKSSDLKIKQSENKQLLSKIVVNIDSVDKGVKNISGDIKKLQTKEDALQTKKEIVESLKDRLKWWSFGILLLTVVMIAVEFLIVFRLKHSMNLGNEKLCSIEKDARLKLKLISDGMKILSCRCEKINDDINACFPIDGNGERNIVAKLKEQLTSFRDEENKSLTSISNSIKAIDISGIARIEENFSKIDAGKKLEEIKDLCKDFSAVKTSISQSLKGNEKEKELSKREGAVQERENKLNNLIYNAEKRVKTDCESSKTRALKEAHEEYQKKLKEQEHKNKEMLGDLEKKISGLSELLKKSEESFEKMREIRGIENENGILKGKLESSNKEKTADKEKLEKYERDLKDEQKKSATLQKEKELQEKKLKGEIEQHELKLQKLSDDSKKLTSERNKYFEANGKLNKELENKVHELSQAEYKASEASKQEKTAKQNLLEAEKALGNERTQKENLAKLLASSENKVKELTGEMKGKEQKIAELQKAIYPSEFNTDEKFAPLKAHLEAWLSEKIPAAETVKSSLGLFAQRAALGEDIWQQALRSISIGITQSLQAKGASASEVFEELMRWNTYLMSFSDEEFQFSLKVPAIGASVDLSWMSVKTKGATRVSRILAWAVYNQYGVAHNAEVE